MNVVILSSFISIKRYSIFCNLKSCVFQYWTSLNSYGISEVNLMFFANTYVFNFMDVCFEILISGVQCATAKLKIIALFDTEIFI